METITIWHMIWYFLIFGFLGWVAEVIYAACIERKFVNRGFLNGPFCPIYGVGISVITLCLTPIRDNIFLLFIGSTLLTTILEFVTGFVLQRVFHTKWWDYSDYKFNFMGYICLSFSLLWGAACTFILRVVIPVVDTLISYIPNNATLVVGIICGSVLLVDFAITATAIIGLNKQIKALGELSSKMREISDKIGEFVSETTLEAADKIDIPERKKELEKGKQELAARYEQVMSKTGLIKRRVLKAFPDLKEKKYDQRVTDFEASIKKFTDNAKDFADDVEEKRQQLVLETYEDRLPKAVEKPFGYGICFNKLFILFMVGNVIGCVLETVWAIATLGHFEMRVGLVYGPFIPVYGFGAVLLTLCLFKFYKVRDLWLFIGSGILGASFEYFASYFQEKLLGTVSWDYSGTLLNIDGRTNLMYALIWGILGLVWVKDVYPVISKFIEKIPKRVGNIIVIALFVFMAYDAFISVSAIVRQNARRDNVPAQTEFGEYLDENFPDEYMEFIYPHMQDVKTGKENSGIVHEESVLKDGYEESPKDPTEAPPTE